MKGMITLRNLIDFVKENAKDFPEGLDTPITCGDSEGNYTHYLIAPYSDEIPNDEDEDSEETITTLFLQYEMHEHRGE